MELAEPAALLSIAVTLSIDWIGENILDFYKNAELAYNTPSKCTDLLQESQEATV